MALCARTGRIRPPDPEFAKSQEAIMSQAASIPSAAPQRARAIRTRFGEHGRSRAESAGRSGQGIVELLVSGPAVGGTGSRQGDWALPCSAKTWLLGAAATAPRMWCTTAARIAASSFRSAAYSTGNCNASCTAFASTAPANASWCRGRKTTRARRHWPSVAAYPGARTRRLYLGLSRRRQRNFRRRRSSRRCLKS